MTRARSWSVVCSLLSLGCSKAAISHDAAAPSPPPFQMTPVTAAGPRSSGAGARAHDEVATTALAAPAAPARARFAGAGAAPVAVAPSPGGAVAPNADMLKVEARITVEVDKVADALVAARKLVAERGGQLVSDVYSDARHERGAALTIRVAAGETSALLSALGELGRVRSQRVSADDVSREFHDSQIVLRNLELTMARYEELLKKASDVKEMLAIEAELARLRTEIDKVKGGLVFLSDRVARSIIYATLQPKPSSPESVSQDFFPGVRGAFHRDLTAKVGAIGGGVSLRGRAPVGVEALVLSPLTGPQSPLLLVTFGGDVYSSKLGGGERRYLDPFLGLRAGVSYTRGRTEAIVPLGLGLDWLKTEAVVLSSDVRVSAMFASKRGLAFAVTPTLGLNVAF